MSMAPRSYFRSLVGGGPEFGPALRPPRVPAWSSSRLAGVRQILPGDEAPSWSGNSSELTLRPVAQEPAHSPCEGSGPATIANVPEMAGEQAGGGLSAPTMSEIAVKGDPAVVPPRASLQSVPPNSRLQRTNAEPRAAATEHRDKFPSGDAQSGVADRRASPEPALLAAQPLIQQPEPHLRTAQEVHLSPRKLRDLPATKVNGDAGREAWPSSAAKRRAGSATALPAIPLLPPVSEKPAAAKDREGSAPGNSIHIGRVDVHITPPPKTVVAPQRGRGAAPSTPLSRGFVSTFGLNQG